MSIWLVVSLSVAVVLVCILALRLHAFLTLLLAGLMVAALAGDDAVRRYADAQVDADKMTHSQAQTLREQSAVATAPARLVTAFGETAGKIGILIALASVIGQCLLESGAAAVIVDRVLRLTGPRRAPEALAASAFVLGIPVFFDTVFYLMVPLARSLRERLGKDYVLFILAILAGGSIAHSLVPPTPGPLMVAEIVGVDIATMMFAGLMIGGCSSVLSLAAARVINRLVDVPLRFADHEPTDDRPAELDSEPQDPGEQDLGQGDLGQGDLGQGDLGQGDLGQGDPGQGDPGQGDPTSSSQISQPGPSLITALNPIVIPVILIAVGSVIKYMIESGSLGTSAATDIIQFMGDKNIALATGALFAFALARHCPADQRATLVSRSLASAGNIILITAAGGAFGAMLRQAGIGDAVGSLAQGVPGLMILPLAFVVTASIRTLQGSATVAMITAAGVLQGFAQAESLPFHPVYLAMAIGAGSKPVSWMTDSAFWVITRMSGMTEAEGLRVISPMSVAMGFSALAFTMLFAAIYPAI